MEKVAITYNETRAKVAELKLEVADNKKQTLITALLKHKDMQNKDMQNNETRGRKVNPNSARQLKLKAIAERKANGEVIKRGRPADPNSASAKKKAEREARIANGEVIKRGRPAGSGVSKEKAKEIVKTRYQIVIDMGGAEEVYSKSFASPKRAITEMKECGFDNYKLKAFNV